MRISLTGKHYAHTGVYGLFVYDKCEGDKREIFPIQIDGQKDKESPCYQMEESMEMKFTFHRAGGRDEEGN